MGWGVGVLPRLQAQPAIDAGRLVWLHAEVTVPVALYWHQWTLPAQAEAPGTTQRLGLLDQIGLALAEGARRAL
jgi:LysR family transcriptional regulator (chromosome initiation inhibitor)